MVSVPLFHHALKAAMRDKLIWTMLAVLVIVCSLSIFMGSIAISEQQNFSVVFSASGLRLAVMMGLTLFVIFFIRRSSDNKDIEFLLSRPITKIQLIASYTCAFIVLAILLGVAQGLVLLAISNGKNADFPTLVWVISIIAENIMMTGLAMFFAMILNSAATAAMATTGFYVLARMMGQILGIVDAGGDLPGQHILNTVMQVISVIIPRLDLFAQSSWLIYGLDNQIDLTFILLQTAVFSLLVFVATTLDLTRRQF